MFAAQQRWIPALIIGIGSAFLISGQAWSYSNYADYQRALKLANRYVQRHRAAEHTAGALSSDLIRMLVGRYYQVGDTWDVLALQSPQVAMRMTADPDQLKPPKGKVALFHYSVVAVKGGEKPQVTISVTQLDELGLKPVDGRVEKLLITMSDEYQQDKKSYVLRDGKTLEVSPDGLRSRITELEMFPLDVPYVMTADRRELKQAPGVPEELGSLAQSNGYRLDPASASWFEQDDFFGRPVQFAWQKGDPWPAYLKTPQGTAVLLHRGGAR